MTSASPSTATPALTAPVILLMSVATGLAVASNYYAQPLLHTIGQQFSLSNAAAGAIVTTAQLSYALGLMLLVPLGDMFERRSLIDLIQFGIRPPSGFYLFSICLSFVSAIFRLVRRLLYVLLW